MSDIDKSTLTERDICSKFINPELASAGWDMIQQIREQYYFTDGQVIVKGKTVKRGDRKFVDFLLYYKSTCQSPSSNLRSSCQTELTERFPSHVVTAWLGNSERIAEKHYLQILDSHLEKAASATCMHDCMQNGVQPAGKGLQAEQADKKKAPEIQELTATYASIQSRRMGDTGFEPVTSTV